mgnify:CR=1 FL=1
MAEQVKFDYSLTAGVISEDEMKAMEKITKDAKDVLVGKSGAGNDFLGWIDLPVDYDKEEFDRIKKAAAKIQSDSEVLIVIGIGGSYLGARAAIEFLRHGFYNNVSKKVRKTPEIYYAGNSISPSYLQGLLDVVGDRDFSVNIISKSGTTTEPAIAFRVFKEKLEKKYGKEEAAKRIYATTDAKKGALKGLATAEGYESFVVPDDVGGRFSVLTAVGLLPQPFVTTALMKNDKLKVALDLNKLWEDSMDDGSKLVTGVVIANNEFVQDHADKVNDFMDAYKESVDFVNSDAEAAAQIIGDHDIIAKEVAQKTIPDCSIVFIEGDEMKTMLSGYLATLDDQNPEIIGGQLPDDAFYYKR